MKLFKELYQYRELLKSSVKKEFRGKYKKSSLGVLWSFINPLMQLIVYALVFPFILRVETENYTMFLLVTLIPWNFFSTVITQVTPVIVNNSNIVKKVYFPRAILPISIITAGLVNFVIALVLVLIGLLISGIGFSIYILYLPLIMILQYLLSIAMALILSSITVYLRDIEYVINVLMLMWFYVTPVLYPAELIPQKYQFIYNLNPMTGIINSYRDILYYQSSPRLTSLAILSVLVLGLLFIGYKVFYKLERNFAEEM